MPLYLYKCPICQSVREDIRCIAQRNEGPVCTHTGLRYGKFSSTEQGKPLPPKKMELQLTPVKGFVK